MSRKRRPRKAKSEQIDSGAVTPVRRDRCGPAPNRTNGEPLLEPEPDEYLDPSERGPVDVRPSDSAAVPDEDDEAVRRDEATRSERW